MNKTHLLHFLYSMFVAWIGAAFVPNQLTTLWFIPIPPLWEVGEYLTSKKPYGDEEYVEARKDIAWSYAGFVVGYALGYLFRHNHTLPSYWVS